MIRLFVTPSGMMQELAMVRGGLLCLSGLYSAFVDVHAVIAHLCVN